MKTLEDLLIELKQEEIPRAKEIYNKSFKVAQNSYGCGYAFGEYETLMRVVHFIENEEWPEW